MHALGPTRKYCAHTMAKLNKYLTSMGSWNADTNPNAPSSHVSSTFALRSTVEDQACRWRSIQTSWSGEIVLRRRKSTCPSLGRKVLPIRTKVCSTTRVTVTSSPVQLCCRLDYGTCNAWIPGRLSIHKRTT